MKILVTGHEGYVGAGMIRFLQEKHELIGWNRKQDIRTIEAHDIKSAGIQTVINCAAVTDRITQQFAINSLSDQVNVGGLRAIVQALKGTEIPLIHISTKDVFGNVFGSDDVTEDRLSYKPKFLVDENRPFSPQTIYAKSKLMAEFVVESHPEAATIRLSSCYTDFDHRNGSWIVKIARSLNDGEPVTVTSGGKQFRDLLHVNDLAILIEKIIEKRQFGLKLNAGGGSENIHSVLEAIHMFSKNPVIHTSEPDDDFGFAFDNQLAEALLDWRPQIKFSDRISLILDNINNQRFANHESSPPSRR